MTREQDKIIRALIGKFGAQVQIDKIQEEALELALAIQQLKCPTKIDKDRCMDDLYKELADMKIMMYQADILFDEEKIDAYVHMKLERAKEKHLI